MEKVKFMLGIQLDQKPQDAQQWGYISNNQQIKIDSLQSLSNNLVNGYLFRPGILVGGIKHDNWTCQQIFALDFDNKVEIKQIDEIYDFYVNLGIIPNFCYTTFSHTKEIPKFRMVFCSNELITDGSLRDKLQATLMGLTDCCDINCKNRARLFLGSKSHKVLHSNYDARIDANLIIKKYWKDTNQFKKYLAQDPTIKNKEAKNKKNSNNSKINNINANTLNSNVDVITTLDYEELKKRLAPTSYEYIEDINLAEYLGVPEKGLFSCIFPNHEDIHPSANIFKINNFQYYKCYGCSITYNIIQITQELSNCKKSEAIEFLKKVYDIEYSSSFVEDYSNSYKDSIAFINSEDFITNFPNLNMILGNRKNDFTCILSHMTNNISLSYQFNEKPLFFLNTETLLEICNKTSRNYISKTITLLCLLDLLMKPEITTLDNKIQEKTRTIQNTHKLKNYVNFFQVPDLSYEHLQHCEALAMTLIHNGFQIEMLSRAYILKEFGIEKANSVFPQYKQENKLDLNDISNSFVKKKSRRILDSINKKGYIIESKLFSDDVTKKQWKISMKTILDKNNLNRIRLNNTLKEEYNIKCNGYPYILVKQ